MANQTGNSGTLARRSEGNLSPWNQMAEMRRRMDDLFNQSFGYTPLSRLFADMPTIGPEADIHETENNFHVLISLPGYQPGDIQVTATNNTVTIRGTRKALFDKEEKTTHRDNGVSDSSSVDITYSLPVDINSDKITANFNHGVLQLELPKAQPANVKTVKVNVTEK